MSRSYDYSKTWVTEGEAQELHELIGSAVEILGGNHTYRQLQQSVDGLRRAREIAGNLLADIMEDH